MDRTAFLKAQPYLYPLERSVSWPPPQPAETSERSSCRRETLLCDDFSLSIESMPSYSSENCTSLSQQSAIVSNGPAFFARKSDTGATATSNTSTETSSTPALHNDSFDPAMCPLELAVNSATLMLPPWTPHGENLPPSFSNRFTSPAASQKFLRRQQGTNPRLQSAQQIQESAVYLQMDGHIYQLDLSYIENLELQDEDAPRPESLVIQFGTACIFRIFSVKKGLSSTAALKAVQTLFVRLLTADDQVPSEFPVRYPTVASPAGSSTTAFSSSNEPGQKDFSRQQTPNSHSLVESSTVQSHNSDSNPQHASNSQQSAQSAGTERGQSSSEQQGTRESPTNEDYQSLTRKRQAALLQSKSDLATLEQLLLHPESGKDPKRLRAVQDQAAELMSAIPANLAATYGPQSQLDSVIQHQNERIHGYELQMNELIQSFWPGIRKGSSGSLLLRAAPLDRQAQIDAEACIDKANNILTQHKKTILEKLAVSLLPSRGS